jgi:hypothetical protein
LFLPFPFLPLSSRLSSVCARTEPLGVALHSVLLLIPLLLLCYCLLLLLPACAAAC